MGVRVWVWGVRVGGGLDEQVVCMQRATLLAGREISAPARESSPAPRAPHTHSPSAPSAMMPPPHSHRLQ